MEYPEKIKSGRDQVEFITMVEIYLQDRLANYERLLTHRKERLEKLKTMHSMPQKVREIEKNLITEGEAIVNFLKGELECFSDDELFDDACEQWESEEPTEDWRGAALTDEFCERLLKAVFGKD